MMRGGGCMDMNGKVVLITGASGGLGKAAATALAATGATVILGCRDAKKGELARAEIAAATGSRSLKVLTLDVADLASIRAAVEKLKREHPALHVLINNAGAWLLERSESKDGLELQWQTNVVGPHYLTLLLLPLLEASGSGRIVNVASTAAGGLVLDDVEMTGRKYDGLKQYSVTKQANRMLTWALARRLAGKPVVANAMSPGLVATDLTRNLSGFLKMMFTFMRLFSRTPEKGADTIVWLASSDEPATQSGKFFIDRKVKPCKFADPAQEEKLWALVARQAHAEALAA
jgi:NAD(P)-dependent dehydrogenase (short-subunit alcohol dehydrogenase family)